MKLKSKQAAFTLTELLVALLISMLVASCMLSLYLYIGRRVRTGVEASATRSEVQLTALFLHQQARQASISLEHDSLLLFKSPGQQSSLLLSSPCLLRHHTAADTLHMIASLSDTLHAGAYLSQFTLQLHTGKAHSYSITLVKKYQRDFIINKLQRHEYFSEPATPAQ